MNLLRLSLLLVAYACAWGATPVTVYMYSEYIDPAIPAQFEAATGIPLRIDTYEAQDEMVARLQAGGAAQYDVIVATDVVVPQLIRLGLVAKLDPARVPNARNVAAAFRDPPYDRGNAYSWPYQWGTIGLMYRTELVKGPVTWALVFDPAHVPGSFVLMDEMRTTMAIALKHLGIDTNSRVPAEIQAAGALIARAKADQRCLGFDGGVGGMNKVLAGEAALAMVYNGDAVKNLPSDGSCGFAVPAEGSGIWSDVMLVSSGAPNPAGAQAFINHILDGRVGAQLSNFVRYASPNEAAKPLINPADLANPAIYPAADLMQRLEYQQDVGDAAPLYDAVWTAVKAR